MLPNTAMLHEPVSPNDQLQQTTTPTRDHSSVSDDDADASDDDDVVAIPDDQRCKYPGKYCGRARVRKSTGTFHRYCQYHRDKANTNQKRWTSARRQQAVQEEQHKRIQELVAQGYFARAPRGEIWTPSLLPHPVEFDHCNGSTELSPEDVGILHELLGVEATGLDRSDHKMYEFHA